MLSVDHMLNSTEAGQVEDTSFRRERWVRCAMIRRSIAQYAAGIGLAASWDRELAVQIGTQIGRDARSRGASFLLGPGVNIYRAPLNGRNFEYFGEDPFLAGEQAALLHHGVQSQGVSVTATMPPNNAGAFLD